MAGSTRKLSSQPSVVVAEQMHRLTVRRSIPDQEIDHPSAVQPAVDVIAEVDHDLVGAGSEQSCVLGDEAMDLLQQVDTTVDVTNRVYAYARRHPRRLARYEGGGRKFVRPPPEQAAQQETTRSGLGGAPHARTRPSDEFLAPHYAEGCQDV